MSWSTIAAIYFITWWVVLFAILPWGVHSQAEDGEVPPGTDPGAPAIPALKAKVVWTTIVSAIVFGAFYWIYVSRLVSLEDLATLWGLLR
jgi:predicted secreted protein